MSGSAGLTFKLFGEDVSASDALEKVQGKAGKVAGAIGAAFAGAKIGEALTQNFDNEAVTAKFTAGLGQTPEVAKMAGDLAGQMYRDGVGASLEEVQSAVGAVGTSMLDLSTAAPADISRITTSAQAVATVMGVDVTEVTRAAGQMFKNGLAPSAEAALDTIAKGASNGTNASGDLLDSLNEYGPSFSAVGVNADTMAAMLKAGLDNGIVSTDKAADAFNEFGIRAIDGSKSTGAAYASLGLDAGAMAQAIAAGGPSAEQATGTIMTALGNMTDPVAQEAAGVALFGSMWEDAGSKAILSMNPATVAVQDATGAAATMGETLADNGANKVETFRRGMDGMLQDATQLPGPLGDVVAGVMAFGPSALAAGSAMVGAIGWLKELGVVTKLQTAAQWLFNIAMDANPIMLVVLGIAALVAAFIWLWNNVEGFRNFFIGVWDAIKGAVSAVVDWFVAAWQAALGWVTGLFGDIGAFLSGLWDWIKGAIGAVVGWFGDAWAAALGWVTGLFSGIGAFLSGLWDWIKGAIGAVVDWFTSAWDGALGFVTGIWNAFAGFVQGVVGAISGVFSGLWDGLKNGAQAAWNFVVGIFTGVRDWFAGVFSGIGEAIRGALSFVGDILKAPINGIIGMINWVIDQLNRISFTLPDWVPYVGGNRFGINLSHIPQLAKGGIVMPQSGGQQIIAGEAGQPEAVLPLSRLSAMLPGGGSGGGATTIVVNLSGVTASTKDELARAIVDTLNGAQRRGMIPRDALAGMAR